MHLQQLKVPIEKLGVAPSSSFRVSFNYNQLESLNSRDLIMNVRPMKTIRAEDLLFCLNRAQNSTSEENKELIQLNQESLFHQLWRSLA